MTITKNNADATISVINVKLEEASRYGIMNTTDDGKIYEFEEKPENPKSTLASMGVYLFKWPVLKELLVSDHQNEQSVHDFGKNIIPMLVQEKGIYGHIHSPAIGGMSEPFSHTGNRIWIWLQGCRNSICLIRIGGSIPQIL